MRPTKFVLAVCLLLATVAFAQEEEKGVANYAYSVFIGTGQYQISDRTIYVIRAPLRFSLKSPDYDSGKFGYSLLLPMSVGITNYKDLSELPELSVESLQTMSITPGVEMQIPVSENWLIKPFAQAGLGWDLKSSSNSFIWGTGARARAWFGENKKWLVGGEVLWAGNNPKYADEPDTKFSRLGIGAEYKWQTSWSPFGRRVSLHGRVLQYYFAHRVAYEAPPTEVKIQNATEIGLSFGLNPPVNILGYKFRQGGVGYERSDEVRAIKLFTTFPF
jgi:hypothetical protein